MGRVIEPGMEPQFHALVRELARVTNHSLEEARAAYEAQFQRLESQARVRTFLPILAARRAREVLSAR